MMRLMINIKEEYDETFQVIATIHIKFSSAGRKIPQHSLERGGQKFYACT